MNRFLLSLSSLAPLVGIVAIRCSGSSASWAIALGVVAVLLVLFLPAILIARRQVEPRPMTVTAVQDESAQIPAYLLTYVFPFAFATVDGVGVAWAYIVFGALLLVLLLRTGLSLVNPVLLVVGIHSYSVTTDAGVTLTLLASRSPLPGSQILARPIAGHAYRLSSIVEGDLNGH